MPHLVPYQIHTPAVTWEMGASPVCGVQGRVQTGGCMVLLAASDSFVVGTPRAAQDDPMAWPRDRTQAPGNSSKPESREGSAHRRRPTIACSPWRALRAQEAAAAGRPWGNPETSRDGSGWACRSLPRALCLPEGLVSEPHRKGGGGLVINGIRINR